MTRVNHDMAAHRFTAEVDRERAVLDYTLSGNLMTITHTGVPRPLEGRGIAGELMREALSAARSNGWQVLPACSYAAAYLNKHPEEAPDRARDDGARQHESDLLDEALDETFPASDPPSVGHSE